VSFFTALFEKQSHHKSGTQPFGVRDVGKDAADTDIFVLACCDGGGVITPTVPDEDGRALDWC
jgi:hypothetical protein